MKKVFTILLLLMAVFSQAQEVSTLKDLRANDTFKMRVTLPCKNAIPNSIWDFENGQKIDIEFTVLSTHQDSIKIAIKPTRWFINFQDTDDKNVLNFLDSDYTGNSDNYSLFYLFDNNSVVANLNINDEKFNINYNYSESEKITNRSRKHWLTDLIRIPKGIAISMVDDPIIMVKLNFDEMLKSALQSFIYEWKIRQSPPTMIDLTTTSSLNPEKPLYIQLISASFDLEPNTFVTLKTLTKIPAIFIQIGNSKIKPIRQSDNTYKFSFFLASPQRAYINNMVLDLTPADSISVEANFSYKTFKFRGIGAENSAYTNEMQKIYANNNLNINEYENIQLMVFEKHSDKMNDFWIRSANLANDYWHASQQIQKYNDNRISEDKISWYDEYFMNTFPFSDHVYQPYTYDYLIDNFFIFKAKQANNSIPTGLNNLQESIPGYYFASAILTMYPRSLVASKILRDMLVRFHLSHSSKEYEDFIGRLQDPEIKEDIISLHTQLMKVEPLSNIKGLDLMIEKQIPLSNKSDHYTILLVVDSLNNNKQEQVISTQLKEINTKIKSSDLEGKVDVCIMVSDANKKFYNTNLQKQIIFLSDREIDDYYSKVVSSRNCYILMRSDGTIINRELQYDNDSAPYFLINYIKEDIEKQTNQDSASSRILIIILSSLISIIITFVIVREIVKRQEKMKRHILDMELKAIRAQINPHFTFNALGSIQYLIAEKKSKEANDYLVNFAKLLRLILSTSEKRLIPLCEEIELLSLYLNLEQLRVPFKYIINIDPNIDIENEEIPGMLIQPVVENAVKHGIVPSGGGKILLNFSTKNRRLYVEVIDSGGGFISPVPKSGFGLKSVKDRLHLINKELHLDIDLKIESIELDGKINGCKVSLSIPI